MVTLINPEQVSHIQIFSETKGVEYYLGGYRDYIWMEEDRTNFFFFSALNYEEGFYRDFKRRWMDNDTPRKPKEHEIVKGGYIYTLPKIVIFSAGKEIKQKYFKTFKLAKEYTTKNFSNVTIIM